MAKAMDVADYIINKSNKLYKKNPYKYHPMSNLYLQKIMYFLNVIHLINYNHYPLINDEKFQKWQYGPVIPSVYKEYESFSGQLIPHSIKHIKSMYDKYGNFKPVYYKSSILDQVSAYFINKHISFFLGKYPSYLVERSHKEPQWKSWSNSKKRNIDYDDTQSWKYWQHHQFWND